MEFKSEDIRIPEPCKLKNEDTKDQIGWFQFLITVFFFFFSKEMNSHFGKCLQSYKLLFYKEITD